MATIPNIATIPSGTTTANFPSDTGFDYQGGKTTFGFYGTFTNTIITVQAAFDGGTTWIDLTDAQGAAVEVTGNDIVSVDIGRCNLRFNVVVSSASTGPINISASSS